MFFKVVYYAVSLYLQPGIRQKLTEVSVVFVMCLTVGISFRLSGGFSLQLANQNARTLRDRGVSCQCWHFDWLV